MKITEITKEEARQLAKDRHKYTPSRRTSRYQRAIAAFGKGFPPKAERTPWSGSISDAISLIQAKYTTNTPLVVDTKAPFTVKRYWFGRPMSKTYGCHTRKVHKIERLVKSAWNKVASYFRTPSPPIPAAIARRRSHRLVCAQR